MNKDETNCRYCGREVEWVVSKAGNRYLAVRTPIYGEDDGRIIKWIYPAHHCPATAEQKQAINDQIKQEHQRALDNGAIVKGQTVEIFKGRKYPIGTSGVIDWVAHEPDQFDVIKVRIVTTSGEKIYVNIANVRATSKVSA